MAAHSVLWERLHVFLTAPAPRTPPTTTAAVLASAATSSEASAARIHALHHALHVANASLTDERARRAKWERRAVVAAAEHAATRDDLSAQAAELKDAERRAARAEQAAEDEARARGVAEEQRDVALARLADAAEDPVMAALRAENAALERRVAAEKAERGRELERLEGVNEALRAEMAEIREAVRGERERFVEQLAVRTRSFAGLEREFKDARETYIAAARGFEVEKAALGERACSAETESNLDCTGFEKAEAVVGEHAARIIHFMEKCQRLEMENDNLKRTLAEKELAQLPETDANKPCSSPRGVTATSLGESPGSAEEDASDTSTLRTTLGKVRTERDALRKQVEYLKSERDGTERLSASSMSTESDCAAKRVQDLEVLLEAEGREAEALRARVCTLTEAASAREREARRLRGEMAAIHSRMRRMACVSLPRGAEELLEGDEDAKRLKEVRETAKEKGGKGGITSATARRIQAKRRVKLGVNENKNRLR